MVRRDTYGGLRVYRYDDADGDLSAGRVATRTQLRRRRLIPADGQPAIGWTWTRYQKWTELYEAKAAQAMPALSPGRLAAYTAARTCGRCGAVSDPDPWPQVRHHSGAGRATPRRRLCTDCGEWERAAYWRASQFDARTKATRWAVDVLADPRSAILAAVRDPLTDLTALHARDIAGVVLLDAALRPTWGPGADSSMGMSALDVVAELKTLSQWRIIGHDVFRVDHVANWSLWERAGIPADDRPVRFECPWWGDYPAGYYAAWLMRPAGVGTVSGPYLAHHDFAPTGLHAPGSTGAAAEITDQIAAALQLMSSGPHPDGQPACPVPAAPTGRDTCGAPLAAGVDGLLGTCEGHVLP